MDYLSTRYGIKTKIIKYEFNDQKIEKLHSRISEVREAFGWSFDEVWSKRNGPKTNALLTLMKCECFRHMIILVKIDVQKKEIDVDSFMKYLRSNVNRKNIGKCFRLPPNFSDARIKNELLDKKKLVLSIVYSYSRTFNKNW